MLEIGSIIGIFGGLLATAGGIWLLVVAFRVSVGWGLTLLFLGWLVVPLVVFLIKHWRAAKTPFLVEIVGSVIACVGVAVAVAGGLTTAARTAEEAMPSTPDAAPVSTDEAPSWDGDYTVEPAEPEQTPEPQWSPEPELSPGPDLDEYRVPPTPSPDLRPTLGIPSEDTEATPEPRRRYERAWGREITINELADYVGGVIQIQTKDRRVNKMTLLGVTPDAIRVQQEVGPGSVSYTIKLDSIVEVRVKE